MKSLIILEGPDCSGKTTLGKYLARWVNGVYFHCTYTEKLGIAMRDYQMNVLANAMEGIKNGQVWVIDRLWPSEVVYSSVFRPHMHADALDTAQELHTIIGEVDATYVYCSDSDVIKRHAAQQDPDHPYDEDKFQEVVQGYEDLFAQMHEDYYVCYNQLVHGERIDRWIQSVLST